MNFVNKLYVGIDNGISGAMCVINNAGQVLHLSNLPTKKLGKDNSIEAYKLFSQLEDLIQKLDPWIHVMVESASKFSPGKMALCSTWRSFGTIEAVLSILNIPWEPINARTWQADLFKSHVRIGEENTKGISLQICKRLFPSVNLIRENRSNPDLGLADALLIAEYCRRHR